jgi:opacity protein-like surface antigen
MKLLTVSSSAVLLASMMFPSVTLAESKSAVSPMDQWAAANPKLAEAKLKRDLAKEKSTLPSTSLEVTSTPAQISTPTAKVTSTATNPKKRKGFFILAPTYIHEDITTPTGFKFGANIYALKGLYLFPNGIIGGASVSIGKPDNSKVSDESRNEAILGYGVKINKFYPYITGSLGVRSIFDGRNEGNYSYYTILPGVKYDITKKLYVDISYRYRDTFTDQVNWRSNTLFGAVGYKVTPRTSILFTYGDTFRGDYTSNSYAFSIIKIF